MRVHVYSDLHLEFGPLDFPPEVRSGALAELVLLAGDIDVRRRSAAWAAATFAQPVAMIGGNHEPYGDSLFATIAAGREAAHRLSASRAQPLKYLEQETWQTSAADGTKVRVIGATLWTDFEAFGREKRADAMDWAHRLMNDFNRIRIVDQAERAARRLAPFDLLRINRASRTFLESELAKNFAGITIVMTHHAPSLRSVPLEFRDDLLTAAYASSLDQLIEHFQPALWVHGHMHSSSDYTIGRTRVVCNPRGYWPHELNPSFDADLVIEIAAGSND